MSEKYLFQKITDIEEVHGMYRNQSFKFEVDMTEAENLEEISKQLVDFLKASGYTYIEGVRFIYTK